MLSNSEISILKNAAQQKNIQIYIPPSIKQQNYVHRDKFMKILSYLRICCSIIQESQQASTNDKGIKHRSNPYFISLLKSLFEYDPEWWQQCEISINGKNY